MVNDTVPEIKPITAPRSVLLYLYTAALTKTNATDERNDAKAPANPVALTVAISKNDTTPIVGISKEGPYKKPQTARKTSLIS